MIPGEATKNLCCDISERCFNNYSIYKNHIDHYIQIIFDILKACISRNDSKSIKEGLLFFSHRFIPLIRRSISEDSSFEIAMTLFKHYLEACYHATEKKNCSDCITIINSLCTTLGGYKASRFRSSVKIFWNFVERMEKDIEKFNDNIYEDRYMELHLALSELRDTIIDITT